MKDALERMRTKVFENLSHRVPPMTARTRGFLRLARERSSAIARGLASRASDAHTRPTDADRARLMNALRGTHYERPEGR